MFRRSQSDEILGAMTSRLSHTPVLANNLPAPVGPYSPGMAFDQLIFVSGQGATDPKTGALAGDDIETQTEQCLANIRAILEHVTLADLANHLLPRQVEKLVGDAAQWK